MRAAILFSLLCLVGLPTTARAQHRAPTGTYTINYPDVPIGRVQFGTPFCDGAYERAVFFGRVGGVEFIGVASRLKEASQWRWDAYANGAFGSGLLRPLGSSSFLILTTTGVPVGTLTK